MNQDNQSESYQNNHPVEPAKENETQEISNLESNPAASPKEEIRLILAAFVAQINLDLACLFDFKRKEILITSGSLHDDFFSKFSDLLDKIFSFLDSSRGAEDSAAQGLKSFYIENSKQVFYFYVLKSPVLLLVKFGGRKPLLLGWVKLWFETYASKLEKLIEKAWQDINFDPTEPTVCPSEPAFEELGKEDL